MPDVGLGVGLLVVAAALLVGGAELFVENLAGAAARLRLSVVAVAVLLAGAEPEEALTSALASADGRPALAVGDALGANITVLTLALGLAAVVAPVPVGRRVRRYAVMSSVAGVLALLVLGDGHASRAEGVGLLAAYAVLVGVVWWREHEPPAIGELAELNDDDDDEDAESGEPGGSPGVALAKALGGLVLMTGGGVAAVVGAERVVAGSGLGDSAVGLTLLALATSAEMLALVAAARRHAVAEIAVAGAVGAATYNATVTLGIAPLVRPLSVHGFVGPAVLAAVLPLLVVLLARGGRLTRPGGVVLLVVYAVATAAAFAGLG
ncbi:MAG: sodium:calcium antiporter [Rhodoferax sp.]|nr:sodium:calcium antiporter [Actinomycetota bacterium]